MITLATLSNGYQWVWHWLPVDTLAISVLATLPISFRSKRPTIVLNFGFGFGASLIVLTTTRCPLNCRSWRCEMRPKILSDRNDSECDEIICQPAGPSVVPFRIETGTADEFHPSVFMHSRCRSTRHADVPTPAYPKLSTNLYPLKVFKNYPDTPTPVAYTIFPDTCTYPVNFFPSTYKV